MESKTIYCLCCHFKELFESANNGIEADMGKPCEQCKYLEGCDFEKGIPNLLSQIEENTGISITCLSRDMLV